MDVSDELKFSFKGDVSNESWIKDYYSVDSSNHQIYPELVCFPQDEDDIKVSLSYAIKNGLSISCRGAGTSLLGQSLSNGLILDFTKYMNKILDLDLQSNCVRVQPGLVKGLLDKELRKHNKFLPPNPASSNYCTIGGMVSNNSSGPYGLGYDSILRYLQQVDFNYYDGSRGFAKDGFCDDRLRKLLLPLFSVHNEISSMYPNVSKNSCGYRLDSIFTPTFSPQNIFAASEGTLAIFNSLELKILDLPIFRSLFIVYFSSVQEACRYSGKILSTHPVALELLDTPVMDSSIKSVTKNKDGCLLFIEYFYLYRDEINTITKLLRNAIYSEGRIIEQAHDIDSINNLWSSRRNALNMAIKYTVGNRKPFTIFEDTAVSIDHLYEYIIYMLTLYNKYDLSYVIYGHLGNGNLHTRPIITDSGHSDNLLNPKQTKILQDITNLIFKKVQEYKGTITAEHGDGISRTPYINNVYNDYIISYFTYVKKSFDPLNILNPGKIII
ncbi:MAG TPA: FAD-binding oxidoreductase [Candidatus Nitrosocosmicus sp.]|nr:FAD-binding oxidoreductase [Candidatus Nitrosocosmicus sp.]